MEYEADYMALYLMKRANYDITSWSKTLRLLITNEKGVERNETMTSNSTHPLTEDRVDMIEKRIKEVEEAFEGRYVTAKVDVYKDWSDYIKSRISVLFT